MRRNPPHLSDKDTLHRTSPLRAISSDQHESWIVDLFSGHDTKKRLSWILMKTFCLYVGGFDFDDVFLDAQPIARTAFRQELCLSLIEKIDDSVSIDSVERVIRTKPTRGSSHLVTAATPRELLKAMSRERNRSRASLADGLPHRGVPRSSTVRVPDGVPSSHSHFNELKIDTKFDL